LAIVSLTVVVCDVVPLLPVMVMVFVLIAARVPTLTVMVEVPEPVTLVGLNVTVWLLPSPVADRATAPSKPPVPVTVTV